MGVVAVIPARGGSKGVPGKNLRPVGGVPLIVRAVRAALGVPAIDQVVVSTDHDGIALAALGAGARVIDRPADLAGDAVGSEPALLHALETLRCDTAVDVLVFIQATSPFIDTDALARAVADVVSGARDSVFSAVPTHVFLWTDSDGGATGVNHDAAVRLRRQDREPQWAETGAFYVLAAEGFRAARHRFFGRIGVAAVDPRGSIEIDAPEDLELAEALAPFLDPPSAAPDAGEVRIDADALALDPRALPAEERILLLEDGTAYLPREASDGRAVERLALAGLPFLLVSSDLRPLPRTRSVPADVLRDSDDKAAAVAHWAGLHDVDLERVAYIGSALDDLPVLRVVGWPVATADAPPAVRAACLVVLEATTAGGAVRELAERMLRDRPEHPPVPGPSPIHELVRNDRTIHDRARPAHPQPARAGGAPA